MLGRLSRPLSRAAQLVGIPDGPEGTRITLEVMRSFARLARVNPDVRDLALQLTSSIHDGDRLQVIDALFRFVRDHIRYIEDINEVETVQTPEVTLEVGAGDCDDKATLLAALLEAVGRPARFAAVAFEPDNFEHVLVETRFDWRGEEWLPLETTPVEGGAAPLGWYPQGVVSKMVRNV